MKLKTGVPFVIAVSVMSVPVQAADYSVTPFATARAEADTNRRLVTESDTSFGAILDVGALFDASTETSSFSIEPLLSLKRFTDDGTGIEQDTEDYYLDLEGEHRFNDKISISAFLNFDNVGVVDAELEDLGLTFGNDNVASTGIGAINENFSVQTISAGPSLNYVLSEKNTLSFGGSYTDATYDNQNTLLADYTNYSVDASWIRQLSLTEQFIVTVFTGKIDPELNALERASIQNSLAPTSLNNELDETGITFGYVKSFNDTLTGNFTIGARKAEGDFPDLTDFDIRLTQLSADSFNGGVTLIDRLDPRINDAAFNAANQAFLQGAVRANHEYQQGRVDNTGLILDFRLEKRYQETTTITAGLTRASVPTGRGLFERDELSLEAVHLLSDRLTGKGKFRYFSTESISEETLDVSNDKTDQIRLEAGLDWRLSEFWTVGGHYKYGRRDSDFSEAADGHGIFVTLGYTGNRYTRSR